jgi:hypothetical protein
LNCQPVSPASSPTKPQSVYAIALRKDYRQFVEQGIGMDKQPHLVGGGLIRSLGGWSKVKALRRIGIKEKADARILETGAFISISVATGGLWHGTDRQLP